MRIVAILAALAFAFPAFARPCNDVRGCVVRAEFCRIEAPSPCHFERLFPEQGVGLCTMAMIPATIQWLAGFQLATRSGHSTSRATRISQPFPDGRVLSRWGVSDAATSCSTISHSHDDQLLCGRHCSCLVVRWWGETQQTHQ